MREVEREQSDCNHKSDRYLQPSIQRIKCKMTWSLWKWLVNLLNDFTTGEWIAFQLKPLNCVIADDEPFLNDFLSYISTLFNVESMSFFNAKCSK